jgi:hypothetical protein
VSSDHQSAAMEGDGWYNRNSTMQAAGNERAMTLWQAALSKVPIGPENIIIADYGCSQGRNSLKPMNLAIETLRHRAGSSRPVEIYHNDLPTNDFSSLFQVIAEQTDGYMVRHPLVFPYAIGRSYFEAILPPDSVHAGWNTWTMQWMSYKAVDAPDHVFAKMSAVPEVRAAVASQQAEDWTKFLELRARELRPGGCLLSLFVAHPSEQMGWVYVGGEMWEAVLDLQRAGIISEHEAIRITVPTAQRSLDDIRMPFRDTGKFAGLVIEHLELMVGPDPFWEELQRTGDKSAFARGLAGMVRAFGGPTIANALDQDRDRPAVIDKYFQRLEERFAANPRRHEFFIACVLLAKTR